MGKIKLKPKAKKGVIKVKALVKHPMETGLRKDKKEEILKDTFKIENDLGLRIEHCWNKFGGSYVRIEMDFSELKTKTMKIGNK